MKEDGNHLPVNTTLIFLQFYKNTVSSNLNILLGAVHEVRVSKLPIDMGEFFKLLVPIRLLGHITVPVSVAPDVSCLFVPLGLK